MWRRQWAQAPIPPPLAYKIDVVLGYARRFGTPVLVETGTYLGEMVEASRSSFQRIWSVELDAALYEAAHERFRPYPHVTIVYGDSSQMLPDIVRGEPSPVLFWLDGHWSGGITARGSLDTPIVAELETVLERPGENDVILIDDAREFGQGDYPMIETLASMISAKREGWHFEVRDDIIRAHRRTDDETRRGGANVPRLRTTTCEGEGSRAAAVRSGTVNTMRIISSHIDVALRAARRRFPQSRAPIDGRSSRRDGRSSITDQTSYLDLCARAAEDPRVFETFRREPVYLGTLEGVTEDHGAQYLRLIQRDSPHLLGERLEAFRANDRFGSPITYEYPSVGRISPVTLRYLKVLSDLERHFGDLTGKRIVEIGVGYGGQARLVLEHWAVQSYTLVDLEPVLRLASRYLTSVGPYRSLVFLPPAVVAPADYDLCISNYAFSELTREVQDSYARSLVASASRGYLTCNFISDVHGIDSWSRDELTHLHAGAHWLPEEPLTYEGNAILVWGDTVRGGFVSADPNTVDLISEDRVQG